MGSNKSFFSECDWSLSVFEASVTRVTIYWNDQFLGLEASQFWQ